MKTEITEVVNIQDKDYDVVIDRRSKFGNPFKMKDDTDEERYRVIKEFRWYFYKKMVEDEEFFNSVIELKGKKIACWCKPKACHGDVIAEILNNFVSYEDQIRKTLSKELQDDDYDYTSVLAKLLNSRETSNQDRRTPKSIFDDFDMIYKFQLDPCTSTSRPGNLGTPHYFLYDPDTGEGTDALQQNWSKYGSVFVNPPWTYLEKWIKKAWSESLDKCTVAVLHPVKTDTKWYHEYVLEKADEINFIRGRVTFQGHENSYIMGIGVAIYNPDKEDRTKQNLEGWFT